jgi:lactoylglutathione lyase
MIKGLEHVGIRVSDMEKSLAFYQEVLGLSLRRRVQLNDEVELAFLHHPEQPSVEVELIVGREAEHAEGKVHHLAFRVEDIDAEIERFKELGVDITDQASKVILGNVHIFFFKGPDGEILELVQR